ncbi:MAG: four helix bundle protein [Patescibacteria group bacterium]|nr:four helix bundle protein [Patescibacteria group bacterium]
MSAQTYKDIIVWQKAHELVLLVYKFTARYPRDELFGLTSQTRRAVVSVAANFVEGFKRLHKNDSLHFYNIAQASLEELRYEILLGKDLNYLSETDYSDCEGLADEVARLIFSWMKSHDES